MPLDTQVGRTTSPWLSFGGRSRCVATLLSFSLIVGAQEALTLKIRPADGTQLQQSLNPTERITIIVVVEDSAGKPISQAAVSFRLPEQGPTGLFTNGLRSEIAITGPDGRASLAPIQWTGAPGTVPLRVTAAKGDLRAGVILNIELTQNDAVPVRVAKAETVPAPVVGRPASNPLVRGASIAPHKPQFPADLQTPKYDPPGFWKSKWFLVALAAGGAVAGGYAAMKLRTPRATTNPYEITPGSITQVPVVIGPPLITVGKP
jgi:hypothetical protein